MPLSTSVFGIVSLRENRNATENRNRKAKQIDDSGSICTKLKEGKDKVRIGIAIGENNSAHFMVDKYAALKLKHLQREICSVPGPTVIDCLQTSEFIVKKTLMFFPNNSSAGLNGCLNDLTAKSVGQTGLNCFRALTL